MNKIHLVFLWGVTVLVLAGCAASSGDWQRDSIFFDRHMADQRLDVKRQELAATQDESASEEIRQATLRRQLSEERSAHSSDAETLRGLQQRKRAAEAELVRVQSEIDAQSSDEETAHQLITRKRALFREIDDLNHHLVFLQKQERSTL